MNPRHVALASTGFLYVALTAAGCTAHDGRTLEHGSSVTPFATVSTAIFSTRFETAENPISEAGRWINGKDVGRDWNDVRTEPGLAFGADFVGKASRYNDPIAHLDRSTLPFDADQYASGTIARRSGYNNPDDKHEVELLLRFRITPGNARGYEVLWGQDGEIAVVRWNGPLGDFTKLGGLPAPGPGPAVDGDRLRAEVVGNAIQVYKNGRRILTVSDPEARWREGQPGIGFWPTPGATLSSYGWSTFEAGHAAKAEAPAGAD